MHYGIINTISAGLRNVLVWTCTYLPESLIRTKFFPSTELKQNITTLSRVGFVFDLPTDSEMSKAEMKIEIPEIPDYLQRHYLALTTEQETTKTYKKNDRLRPDNDPYNDEKILVTRWENTL